MTAKQKVLEVLQQLPDDATFEQIQIDLQILQSIEESRESGVLLTTEEVYANVTNAIEQAAANARRTAHG